MGAPVKDTRALKELYKTVKRLQNDHTLKDVDLHTPYGVENDCLVPALWCFVDNLEKINVKSKYISIITSRMPKRINKPSCKPCDYFKKTDRHTFLSSMRGHIEQIFQS
ncbi:hypothetical protein AOXY_G301 [Acipenser oxyrinchus oxyrinchus]|uniref:Interleukin n=1 Tax=Acipenser oxyrinchus oxyrinchus TaxID=40147 RepID=A0AAD8GKB0_ACIOX|nr:hypothetical protein AOXY_G301 [Acipenser oxyrinchus oxyrinchus]